MTPADGDMPKCQKLFHAEVPAGVQILLDSANGLLLVAHEFGDDGVLDFCVDAALELLGAGVMTPSIPILASMHKGVSGYFEKRSYSASLLRELGIERVNPTNGAIVYLMGLTMLHLRGALKAEDCMEMIFAFSKNNSHLTGIEKFVNLRDQYWLSDEIPINSILAMFSQEAKIFLAENAVVARVDPSSGKVLISTHECAKRARPS